MKRMLILASLAIATAAQAWPWGAAEYDPVFKEWKDNPNGLNSLVTTNDYAYLYMRGRSNAWDAAASLTQQVVSVASRSNAWDAGIINTLDLAGTRPMSGPLNMNGSGSGGGVITNVTWILFWDTGTAQMMIKRYPDSIGFENRYGGYADIYAGRLFADGRQLEGVVLTNDFARLYMIERSNVWDNALSTSGVQTVVTDSYWVPTILSSAPTVTISRANGSLCSLVVLESPCVIRMAESDWSTNGVGRVSLDLVAGTNTITFDTNTITWGTAFVSDSTNTVSVQLRKHYKASKWQGRQ